MAEEMFMFAVTTGIFTFLAAVLFWLKSKKVPTRIRVSSRSY